MRHTASLLVICALLGGCQDAGGATAIDTPLADEAGNLTQAQANTITTKCGAPKRWLEAKVGELKFQVDADGDYDKAACVLKEISRSGATKFGFVGNEVYRADEPK